MHAAIKWLQETKGSIGAVLFALSFIAALVGAAKIPAKLDLHMTQAEVTNHKLDVLICLEAKLASPIACIAANQ